MANFKNLNPYERHKLIINEYVLNRPGRTKLFERDTSKDRRDIDVIRDHHKFLWDGAESSLTWEENLAKSYYDRLFKEYCICDLSQYKKNKVALRWRTKEEVIDGKGQFSCGSKICNDDDNLRTWEVNFAYMEHGEKKNALIKLRLCTECSAKLNFRSQKREIKRMCRQSLKKKDKKHKKSKKKHKKSKNNIKSDKVINLTELDRNDLDGSSSSDSPIPSCSNKDEDAIDNEQNVWKTNDEANIETTRDAEFEQYLEDLLF